MNKGRPKSLSGRELELMQVLYFEERMSVRKVADAIGVSHMTVWRALSSLPAET